MDTNFSPRVKDVISFSREEALRLGHDYIGTEHFLLGIIREGQGVAIQILKNLNVDIPELRKMIESTIKVENPNKVNSNLGNIPLVKQAEKTLKITYLEAKMFKSHVIGTEHLLLSILKDENNVASRAMFNFNVDYELVKSELEHLMSHGDVSEDPKAEISGTDDDDEGPGYGTGGGKKGSLGSGASQSGSKAAFSFLLRRKK